MLNIFTLLSLMTPGFVLQVSCWASLVQRAWLRSSVQRTARSASTWPWFIPRSPPLSAHVPNNLRGLRPACLPPSPEPHPTPHLCVSCLPVCFTPPQHVSHSTITLCSWWGYKLFTGTGLKFMSPLSLINLFFFCMHVHWYLFDSLYIPLKCEYFL